MSPTARSLRHLRERGYMVAVVERWNPGARVRQDLFRFADLLAVGRPDGFLAVQVCAAGDRAKRLNKLITAPVADHVRRWLECGGTVELQSWGKRGARGKRKVWDVTTLPVTLDRLPAAGDG